MLFSRLFLLTTAALAGSASIVSAQEMAGRAGVDLRATGPASAPAGTSAEAENALSDRGAPRSADTKTADVIKPAQLEAVLTGAEVLTGNDQKPESTHRDRRRLAPPSLRTPTGGAEEAKLVDINWSNLPVDPVTTAAALAMVVGLFLLTATAFRRAAPRSQRMLPSEVAAVLGRIPLSGKQTAHLLKVGSKLVLVSITPDEVKTLTEVTDPAEVTRLLGFCEQGNDNSASNAFRDVFDRLANEPATPGFLGDQATLVDPQKLAAAYANTPGGRSVG